MTTPRILLACHSSEGHTTEIAQRMADRLRLGGATVDLVAAEGAPSPQGYDGVILGDSIHMGRHSRQLTGYAGRFGLELGRVPVALFQVSLTSATDDDEHRAKADHLLRQFLDATGLQPELVGMFAGALAYTRYGWLKVRIMRRIAAAEGRDLDTSRDHDYTDWAAVEGFADDALAVISSAPATNH